jgi:hypothetical protein
VTSADTSFAAGTFIKINRERVLLAGLWFRKRDKIAIILRLRRQFVLLVLARKALNGSQRLLFSQQFIHERERGLCARRG